ncbi:MAG: hypothetical protein QME41_09510 [Actinomycetota bacterium]|nr:hypothetical protein [Actinomycetota bacterium]
MNTFSKIFKGTNLKVDTLAAIVVIIALGLLSNYFAARQDADTTEAGSYPGVTTERSRSQIAPPPRETSLLAQSAKPPVFSTNLMLETPDGRKTVPGKAVLERIEVVSPEQVPDNEGLGSYANSNGGVGESILKQGGKAYKMTFTYVNEGKYAVNYNSRWLLYSDELEKIINSYGDRRFTYAYGQVPVWTKISSDPVFYDAHVLKPGQKVTETVWFFPCPPVKKCLISDFEMREPVEIVLP